METKFNRVADVEFQRDDTEQTLWISNVPFLWDAQHMASQDEQAIFAVRLYSMELGIDVSHMRVLSIVTSEIKAQKQPKAPMSEASAQLVFQRMAEARLKPTRPAKNVVTPVMGKPTS